MPKTPEPPADLGAIPLPLETIPNRVWYRIGWPNKAPLFWDRSGEYRFDSPGSRYGVCYLATSLTAAFCEIWGDAVRDEAGIPFKSFESRCVYKITLPEKARLLSLKGQNVALLRATSNCFSGDDYALSQRWAAGFMTHPDAPDGLVYFGRRSADDCLALFGNPERQGEKSVLQDALTIEKLGDLVEWKRFYMTLVHLRIRTTAITRPLGVSFDAL